MPISTIGSNSLNQTSDLVINGQTVGKGNGSQSQNTAHGVSALAVTTGNSNTAIGYQAALNNTTGSSLVAIGNRALVNNTTGSDNCAVGDSSQLGTTTGTRNVSVGSGTLYANTTGSYNVAMGAPDSGGTTAMRFNTTGSSNVGIGSGALAQNTTASNNVAVGYQALYTNATGATITAVGHQAAKVTTVNDGTFIGAFSGTAVTTGAGNTFLGYASGYYITTGSKNTIIGQYTGNQDGLDIRTASNYVVLSDGDGNRAAYWQSGGGWVQKNNSTSWSTYSDQRIKENIVDVSNGLSVVTALRPVEFDYKIGDKKHDIGFIAQEYKNVLPNQIHETTSGGEEIQALTNGEPLLSIQQNLVPYLVDAIKQLKTIVDAQAAEIAELKAKVA